jgi:hypothetical protein
MSVKRVGLPSSCSALELWLGQWQSCRISKCRAIQNVHPSDDAEGEKDLSSGERKITQAVVASMHFWNNVLKVKHRKRRVFLAQLAVFATITRPFSNAASRAWSHCSADDLIICLA